MTRCYGRCKFPFQPISRSCREIFLALARTLHSDQIIMLNYTIKPLFHIYPNLDAAEYRNTLIGSIVKYPDLPIEGYIPYKAGKQPRQIVPSLDPQPTRIKEIKFLTHRMKDTGASSLLDDYLEEYFQGIGAKDRTEARLWHMDLPGKKFQKLLKNKPYVRQLIKLLRNCHGYEGYFVTDIITVVQAATAPNESPDGRAEEISDLSSLPREPDTQNHVQGVYHAPRYFEGETIMFLGYSRIRLEKSSSVLAKLTRAVFGKKHGLIVRDESDYWPQAAHKTVEENTNTLLGGASERTTDIVEGPSTPALDRHAEIATELGFEVEIVG